MGRYLTPAPSGAQSGKIKQQQVFKTSGIFTPSQKLLDAGGVVEVRCVGGGGAGGQYAGGSSGMDITRLVTVTGPVTVTIGAGANSQGKGGETRFGALLTALGGISPYLYDYHGGKSSGEGSQPGCPVFGVLYGSNWQKQGGAGGGSGGSGTSSTDLHAPPNTGGGGGGATGNQNKNGGSGICIVTWEE